MGSHQTDMPLVQAVPAPAAWSVVVTPGGRAGDGSWRRLLLVFGGLPFLLKHFQQFAVQDKAASGVREAVQGEGLIILGQITRPVLAEPIPTLVPQLLDKSTSPDICPPLRKLFFTQSWSRQGDRSVWRVPIRGALDHDLVTDNAPSVARRSDGQAPPES